MSKLRMLGKKLGVEKIGKTNKKNESSLFTIPESSDSTGYIKYIGEEYDGPLQKGMKVIFSNQREKVYVQESEIMIMDPENVVAILEELSGEETQS